MDCSYWQGFGFTIIGAALGWVLSQATTRLRDSRHQKIRLYRLVEDELEALFNVPNYSRDAKVDPISIVRSIMKIKLPWSEYSDRKIQEMARYSADRYLRAQSDDFTLMCYCQNIRDDPSRHNLYKGHSKDRLCNSVKEMRRHGRELSMEEFLPIHPWWRKVAQCCWWRSPSWVRRFLTPIAGYRRRSGDSQIKHL